MPTRRPARPGSHLPTLLVSCYAVVSICNDSRWQTEKLSPLGESILPLPPPPSPHTHTHTPPSSLPPQVVVAGCKDALLNAAEHLDARRKLELKLPRGELKALLGVLGPTPPSYR